MTDQSDQPTFSKDQLRYLDACPNGEARTIQASACGVTIARTVDKRTVMLGQTAEGGGGAEQHMTVNTTGDIIWPESAVLRELQREVDDLRERIERAVEASDTDGGSASDAIQDMLAILNQGQGGE